MRTTNSIKNTITTMISSCCSIILGIVAQALFLKILNIEYLGINGLFNNIISMLSIAELGIGNAIIFNMYKPLYNNDTEKIKSLMHFYKKAYNIIGTTIFVIGLLLTPFLKYIIGEVSININLTVVYLLFLFGTVSSYFLSYNRSILYADQKNYIINISRTIYLLVYNVLQIIILYLTKNYYLYLSTKIICQVIENYAIYIYAQKKYPYLTEKNYKKLDRETEKNIFTKVKALFFHKIANFIIKGTDNIIISSFIGIKTVGLYSNYYTIIYSITYLFTHMITSVSASIGNLLIEKNYNKNYEIFKKINFLNFWISTVSSVCIFIIMESFIIIWIGKKYLLEKHILFILVINYFLTIMQNSYIIFKDAAGIWKEDKFIPLIESLLNILISILLVKTIGLSGVFLGTIISSLLLWCYSYPKYVYKHLFKKTYKNYILENLHYITIFILVIFLSYNISTLLIFKNNYIQLLVNIVISIIIPNLILTLIFYKTKNFNYFILLIKKIIRINKMLPNSSKKEAKMHKNKILFFKSKQDLYLNFDNNNNKFIIITGSSGSGKSTLATKLSQDNNYQKISLDLVFGYEKSMISNFEKEIIEKFKKKYKNWNLPLINNQKKDKEIMVYWANVFYDFIINETKDNNSKIIIEGYFFINCIDINKIKKNSIIIKRTSVITSSYRRVKRQLKENKIAMKKQEISYIRYVYKIFAIIKYTIIYQLKWYQDTNKFIKNIL